MSTNVFYLYFFQLLGLAFVLIGGISKNERRILLLNFCANVCSTIVMILAGRFDGAAATVLCTVRSFLFLGKDRIKGDIILWISCIAHLIVGIISWQGALSILIIIAPIVLCCTMWFGNVRVIKYGTITSDLCWMIFDISSGVYIEAARDLAEILSNCIGLIRNHYQRAARR